MSGGAGCGGPVDEERHARLVAEQNARYALRVGQAAVERCEELEAQVADLRDAINTALAVLDEGGAAHPTVYGGAAARTLRAVVAQQRAAETKEQP